MTADTDALHFRPGRADDADAITALVRAAYAKWVPLIGREPMPMRVDYAEALARHEFDLATDAQRILGLAETLLHADHLWLENIAVAPDAMGRGIGRALLARVESSALAAGRAEVRLLTNGAFADNIGLYTWLGYRIEREEPFMNGVTVYLRKAL